MSDTRGRLAARLGALKGELDALAQRVETIRQSQKADADLDHEMDERVALLDGHREAVDRCTGNLTGRILMIERRLKMGVYVERAASSGDAPLIDQTIREPDRVTVGGEPLQYWHGGSVVSEGPLLKMRGDAPYYEGKSWDVQSAPASFPSEAALKAAIMEHLAFRGTAEILAAAYAVDAPAIRAEAVTAFVESLFNAAIIFRGFTLKEMRADATRYLATLGGDHA
jgi:hypothetical protein